MPLSLHYHPLSSYCWKALIALYETCEPFEPLILDLGDPAARSAFQALWPPAKMPVLQDDAVVVAEASVIVEYLDQRCRVGLIPSDPDLAWRTRMMDRVFDLNVQGPMQKIVGDRLRPEVVRDPHGVAQARAELAIGLGLVESRISEAWAMGDTFTLADCAAAPALYYADKVAPLKGPRTVAYLDRLKSRPSFARVLAEAEPYFAMFPQD